MRHCGIKLKSGLLNGSGHAIMKNSIAVFLEIMNKKSHMMYKICAPPETSKSVTFISSYEI
jgi:hypothetical protein